MLRVSKLLKSVILPVNFQINLNGALHLDEGIWVVEGASVLSHQVRDLFCVYKHLSYFAQLALGLLRCDTINNKATLGVIDQREMLYGLVNADDIHKTTRLGCISSDLNLNEWLHADLYFTACQGRFKSIP